jgi:hypothetical protein
MITEMQERVALEIYRSMTRDVSENPLLTPVYYNAAFSAIKGMEEPTHDMLYCGVGYSDWILSEAIGSTKEDYMREMKCGYVSMIKAALGEYK